MRHRDIPKKNIEDGDDLKFAPYASRVAQGILNYSQNETFIISLEGEWGSGKTSVINFIKEDLKKQQEKVEILDFNPWLITGIEQIIKVFFGELIKVLSYGSFAVKWNEDIKKDLQTLASLILPDNINIDVGLIKLGYKPKDVLLPKSEKTLAQIKEKINKYLRDSGKKIVVIIDDIDRLTDKETELIFRLAKGIADFDNLIYILLYDKKVVTKSLEKFKSENGQKYLEKIVQYPLTIPKAHKIKIKNLLFKELDKILKRLHFKKVKYIFNQETWNQVHLVIDKYIKTVRDINQIANIISFEYPIIATEVNFTDFFIISLIKLKNHTLYELIQNKPNNFFIDEHKTYEPEKEEKRIIENFENNMKDFHEFKDLLEIIFPVFSEDDYRSSDSHKAKYISDIYYFENYFSFSVSDDKLSMKEYYEIKNLFISSDFEAFKEIMLKADKEQKSTYFLDMFEEFDEHIKKEEIENVFFNALKMTTKDNLLSLLLNVSSSYQELAYDVLVKHPELDEFILNFYKTNKEVDFKLKVNLLQKINKEIKEAHSDKKLKILNKTLLELNSLVKKELESIRFENIGNYKGTLGLIGRFDLFGASIDKLKEDINKNIFKSTDNFFKILNIFKGTNIVNGSYEEHYISKESLEKLLELKEVENYIDNLDKSDLTNEQNTLLTYWKNNYGW
ncbi:MAG: P-loop NTPase fold protein [Sulfurimonas sp.]|uniref:P-loop NTPase fold protein n=1 Tax=Sulfurimonas sp. TaxID=2022749 RepID=UPI002607D77F|nr:P-loop NTPase fold protein [Sulfurimonas sp.]MDD5400987.1 P-loop NTPase fold protein [Sulfurimonas sp.]